MRYKEKKEKHEKVCEAVNFIPDKRELSEVIRLPCSKCKRVTPHIRGICSWHPIHKED